MVEQYPDSIVITIENPPTEDPDTGIWTEGSKVNHTFDCRAETNGAGRQVTGRDGILIDYAFEVYLPKMTLIIPAFSEYTLTLFDGEVIAGKTKHASNGQLNSRIWL